MFKSKDKTKLTKEQSKALIKDLDDAIVGEQVLMNQFANLYKDDLNAGKPNIYQAMDIERGRQKISGLELAKFIVELNTKE